MIVRITGQVAAKTDMTVVLNVDGICYEIFVPAPVLQRIDSHADAQGRITFVTYHYFQLSQSSGLPVLVGFLNEVERDFFLQIITVSGIGPRAAVKALNKPFSEISRAITDGDIEFLKSLPGIGSQKAKEIVAKLQGKVSRFGLIRDGDIAAAPKAPATDWQQEALDVLLQLQYKRGEAAQMIEKVLKRNTQIASAEELLNEIYQQRMNH